MENIQLAVSVYGEKGYQILLKAIEGIVGNIEDIVLSNQEEQKIIDCCIAQGERLVTDQWPWLDKGGVKHG